MYIVYVACVLLKNFDRIQKLDPKTQNFSNLFEELKIRTNVTEDKKGTKVASKRQIYSGKNTISHPIWCFLRRLILGVAVTKMTD
jgi:hypothetical protein